MCNKYNVQIGYHKRERSEFVSHNWDRTSVMMINLLACVGFTGSLDQL